MMNCSEHPQKKANGSCVYCGKFFCEDCLVEVDNKYYCKEHVKLLIPPRGNRNAPRWTHRANNNEWQDSRRYNEQRQAPPNQPNIYINNNMNQDYGPHLYYPRKSRLIALLLCIFLGVGGFHRFYVGKIGTGLLWLFTGGFFGIGWLVDLFFIIVGGFRDGNGYLLD